jgi:hypothetical protein
MDFVRRYQQVQVARGRHLGPRCGSENVEAPHAMLLAKRPK